jgi:hypothetical protein
VDESTKAWIKDWLPKLAAAIYPLCVLAFLGSHERPGSPDSVWFAVTAAVLPTVVLTAVVLGVMWLKRRGG